MGTHPLVTFVQDTFGQQFSDLLPAGYGAEPSSRHKGLFLMESEGEVESAWVIKLVARHPPCREEPLVLAALLKLLVSQSNISHHLEFELSELLAELRWQDQMSMRVQVETVIGRYVRLLYDKQANTRAGHRAMAAAGGGYYHLLTGYVRAKSSTSGTLSRVLSRLYFDAGFIRGLKQGRVCFVGIDFGPLRAAN